MSKYKTLIFDIDGTVVNTDELIANTFLALYDAITPNVRRSKEELYYYSGPPLEDNLRNDYPEEMVDICAKTFREITDKLIETELVEYKDALQGILDGTATIADMFSGLSPIPISAGDAIRGNYFRTAIEAAVPQTGASELSGEVNEQTRSTDRYDVASVQRGGMPTSAAEQIVAVFNLDGEEFATASMKLRESQLAISGGMY